MITLETLRENVQAFLPGPCMLKTCRQEDWLFVSDVPRRQPAWKAQAPGWEIREKDSLLFLDPDPSLWAAVIDSVPKESLPDITEANLLLRSLALRLTRAPVPAERQPILPLRILFKAVSSGDTGTVLRRLPPLLSALQREKQPLPEACGWALIWAMNRGLIGNTERSKQEVRIC